MASTTSLVNFSLWENSITRSGWLLRMELAMAVIRWVLPRPAPPYMNRGLYSLPGWSLTASAAAYARRLEAPTMKFSKV